MSASEKIFGNLLTFPPDCAIMQSWSETFSLYEMTVPSPQGIGMSSYTSFFALCSG